MGLGGWVHWSVGGGGNGVRKALDGDDVLVGIGTMLLPLMASI